MVKLNPEDKPDMLQAITNSSRLTMLAYLEKTKRANISQIAKAVGLDRSTVVYHLSLLSKVGLVEEQTVPIRPATSTGVIGRFFVLNTKNVSAAVELLTKELATILAPKGT